MQKRLLVGPSALIVAMAAASSVYANPINKNFGNATQTNTVTSTANADANGGASGRGGDADGGNGGSTTAGTQTTAGAGGAGGTAGRSAGGAGGRAQAWSESFNTVTEVISYQTMSATVTGAPLAVLGGVGGNGGKGGNGDGGTLRTGNVTVASGAGTFGGINVQNVSSGLYNASVGGVSVAAHSNVNIGN